MKFKNLHSWDLKPKTAVELQRQLVKDLILKAPVNFKISDNLKIAAVDVSYSRIEKIGFACVLVWDLKTKQIIEETSAKGEVSFPYMQGLLSFREAPLALSAIAKIQSKVDVFIFDGQGIAHPRGIGLASHMGLFLQKPCIGCAKSRLYGSFSEPAAQVGSQSFLYKSDAIIGIVFRTKRRCKPVFISAGHLIDISTSVSIIKLICGKYRIPDPLRIVDLQTKKFRKNHCL